MNEDGSISMVASGENTAQTSIRRELDQLEAPINIQKRLENIKTGTASKDAKDWNKDDGMTESIMSSEEDK